AGPARAQVEVIVNERRHQPALSVSFNTLRASSPCTTRPADVGAPNTETGSYRRSASAIRKRSSLENVGRPARRVMGNSSPPTPWKPRYTTPVHTSRSLREHAKSE